MSLVTKPEDLSREGEAMTRSAQAFVVRDDASYTEAGERRKTIRLYLQRVADLFDPIDRAQIEARRVTIQQRKGVEQHALEADEIYGRGRLAYEADQDAKRIETERLARRERERLEAEAAEHAKAETDRLRKAEEDRRLVKAADAEARGDTEAAERIIAAPIVVPAVAPAVVFSPPPRRAAVPPKVEGISSRVDWDFEVADPALVPDTYKVIDERKIRGVVRALKDQTHIPGVRVFPRRNEAVRTR
jgi:hypothetical protein